MIVVKTLLAPLARADVSEIVLRSDEPPIARVGSASEEVDEDALSSDDVLTLLYGAGGSRYTESLGAKPTQWRTRVEGVGAIVVSATLSDEVIEAHFMRGDAIPGAKAQTTSVPPPKPPKSAPAPRQDGDAPPASRRKSRAARRSVPPEPSGVAPLPRARELAASHPSSAPPPAQRGLDLDDLNDGHMLRAQLKTLPGSEVEIDLDLTAGDIPSVPRPAIFLDEGAAAPTSPRTLPEARFSREPVHPTPTRVAVVVTEAAFARDVHDAPTPTPFATDPTPEPAPAREPVAELTEPFAPSLRRPPTTPRPARTTARTTRPFAREPHTAVFRKLLRAAREAGASDLHLVADRPPLLRVAGQVVARGEPVDARVIEDMMVSRVPSRLAAAFDHDGSCDFAHEEAELGRFRVNVSRQHTGIKASLRLVGQQLPTLGALGLPDVIALATRHRQGLIVLGGPSGHGKTTTLAAVVDLLNRETTRHIITVEDPIEFVHPRKRSMLSQREVGTHTRSFQAALRAAVREDPDVIVVGELRDAEAARLAIAAAEAGHLVIGTMSTTSAQRTIERLIDLFPPGDQAYARAALSVGLRLVVNQRLLPDAQGRGMVAAAEVLPGMVPLWNLIRDGRTYQIPSLQQRGKALGVIRLDDALADLVRAGRALAPAALAVAESPDELAAALGLKPATAPRGATSPIRPPEPRPPDPGTAGKGGFLERAGAIFGGKKGA